MNAPLDQIAGAAPARAKRSRSLLGLAASIGLGAGALYLVLAMYAAGELIWALTALVAFSLGFYVYLSGRTLAWRYLFPGVAAMLAFVAFPLVYTAQIGFTNYSSSNLLSRERAAAYLLDQTEPDEARAYAVSLHGQPGAYRLLLQPLADAAPGAAASGRWASPVLPSTPSAAAASPLKLAPATDDAALGLALTLKDWIAQRPVLMALSLALPDAGAVLVYQGVHEFGPVAHVWRQGPEGSLISAAGANAGKVFKPNEKTGYFESDTGERLQPGFHVGVGWAHYARMVLDADFRAPFLSIFGWTVVFSALTVLFSLGIGATLAVVLNWESLRYRTVYRTLLFLPYAVPGFISILVFKGLFNQNFGEINAILNAIFGVKPAWFADPLLAKVMLLIVNTWLGYPYIMVLCAGLLKAIPADLYEASAIAGAGPLTNFWRITAPLIVRPLTPLLISAFAYNFNNFVLIALLTNGRPDVLSSKLPAGTNDILVSYTYRIAFQDSGQNYGLAAAISTVIFLLVAAMSIANLKLARMGNERKA